MLAWPDSSGAYIWREIDRAATADGIREMTQGLPEEPGYAASTAEQPLIPELEAYRSGFRWARSEIRNLTGSIGAEAYNARPSEKSWSAAECVEHLSATGRELLPALEEGIARARENGWLAHGPFEYGWIEKWFARQSGAEELPPRRRFKAPKLYAPAHRHYDPEEAVEGFLSIQDRYIETVQLASGVDLARIKIGSPAMPLLRISLGMWLNAMVGHQKRHLWQAREAIRKAG